MKRKRVQYPFQGLRHGRHLRSKRSRESRPVVEPRPQRVWSLLLPPSYFSERR